MTSKAKKTRRKVLAASCILSALIVAGSSFAWFTSSDEVVNKLSATSDYNVTAYEDFTPPENWTPGQTVKKEVAAINTGNVDAFVKATLSSSLTLTRKGTPATAVPTTFDSTYVELTRQEAQTLQAGGRLVLKPTNETAGNLSGDLSATEDVSSKDYEPELKGLYLFERRYTAENGGTTTIKTDYVGYFFVPGTDGAEGTYYAVTVTDKATVDDTTTLTAALDTKETVTIDNSKFTYNIDTAGTIKATYNADTTDNTADDIIIDIAYNTDITNTSAATGDKWLLALEAENKNPVFYYEQVLKAEAKSSNMITSVTLDENITKDAFIAMDYNLSIKIDSAQVVDDRTTASTAVTAANAQDWSVMDATYTSDTNVAWATPTT